MLYTTGRCFQFPLSTRRGARARARALPFYFFPSRFMIIYSSLFIASLSHISSSRLPCLRLFLYMFTPLTPTHAFYHSSITHLHSFLTVFQNRCRLGTAHTQHNSHTHRTFHRYHPTHTSFICRSCLCLYYLSLSVPHYSVFCCNTSVS